VSLSARDFAATSDVHRPTLEVSIEVYEVAVLYEFLSAHAPKVPGDVTGTA
jgi:hypothetical protein